MACGFLTFALDTFNIQTKVLKHYCYSANVLKILEIQQMYYIKLQILKIHQTNKDLADFGNPKISNKFWKCETFINLVFGNSRNIIQILEIQLME